jgi:hypothetical protein
LVSHSAVSAQDAPDGKPETATRALKPYTRGETKYRWMDIADNRYSHAFRRKFRYRADQVKVTYTTTGATLRGKLTARGLKPNFAYQVKLEGRPTKKGISTDEADTPSNWANTRLGKAGRWWCVECDSNTWVDSYGSSYHEGHSVLGYLLFDFLVTDNRGNAEHEFVVDSSFHVLWKVSQYGPAETDSKARTFRVEGRRDYGYSKTPKRSEVSIYAEREYGRCEPGKLRLPSGRYACRLLLTEESFHAYGWGDDADAGGHWAHCLSDEYLEFTIKAPEEPALEAPGTPPATGPDQ